MKKVSAISLTMLLAMVLCWSCTFHNIEEDVYVDPCSADTTAVSFQDTILPIFVKYCSDQDNGVCHQSGTFQPPLTTHAEIKSQVDGGRIQARMFDQTPSPMPPSNTFGPKGVSECDKQLVLSWMADGAPNN